MAEPAFEQGPFLFDNYLWLGIDAAKNGDWLKAANIFEKMNNFFKENDLWLKTELANALYNCGRLKNAAQLARQINNTRPNIATKLIEARAAKKLEDYQTAIKLYQDSLEILEGKQSVWT